MSIIHHYRAADPEFVSITVTGERFNPTGFGYIFLDFESIYLKLKCWYTQEKTGTIIAERYMHSLGVRTTLLSEDPLEYKISYKSHDILLYTTNFHSYIPRQNIILPKRNIKISSLHVRMGHINSRYLLKAANYGTIVGISENDNQSLHELLEDDCEACLIGKARRRNAIEGSRDPYIENTPFNVVYSDICQVTESIRTKRDSYFITFKCAMTNYLVVYPLKRKSDASGKIKQYVNWVKNQFYTQGYRVKKLFSDQGAEYLSNKIRQFLEEEGIETHTTSAYTPASNGVAERVNLTIMNDVRSILVSSRLPSYFWVEAAIYSTFLRNYMINDRINDAPATFVGYESLDVNDIHEFGEKCFVKLLPEGAKTDPRSTAAIYLGPSPSTYGYIIFVPVSHGVLKEGYFLETRHVSFMKKPTLYVDNPDPTLEFELFTIFDNELNNENSITIPPDPSTLLDNYIHPISNQEGGHTQHDMFSNNDEDDDFNIGYNLSIDDNNNNSDIDMEDIDIDELQQDKLLLPDHLMNEEEFEAFKVQYNKYKLNDTQTTIKSSLTNPKNDSPTSSTTEVKNKIFWKDHDVPSNSEIPEHDAVNKSNSSHNTDEKGNSLQSETSSEINNNDCVVFDAKKKSEIQLTKSTNQTIIDGGINPIENSEISKPVLSASNNHMSPQLQSTNNKQLFSASDEFSQFALVNEKPIIQSTTNEVVSYATAENSNDTKTKEIQLEKANTEEAPTEKTTPHSQLNIDIQNDGVTLNNNTAESSKMASRTDNLDQLPVTEIKSKDLNDSSHITQHKPKTRNKKKLTSKISKDKSKTGERVNKWLEKEYNPPRTRRNFDLESESMKVKTGIPYKDLTEPNVNSEKNLLANDSSTNLPKIDSEVSQPANRKRVLRNLSKRVKVPFSKSLDYAKIHSNSNNATPKLRYRTQNQIELNEPTPNDPKKIKLKLLRVLSLTLQPTIPKRFPRSYKEATSSILKDSWLSAIKEELTSHSTLHTWDTKPIIISKESPLINKSIFTKWVFTIKADGTFKARLVARGDMQSTSTYDQTYSPTLRAEIARTILSQNASSHWFFKQFDFKTAYLNSVLTDEIYIHAPDGSSFIPHQKHERVIYKLQRGLYGLKQAGRLWYLELSSKLNTLYYFKDDTFPSTFIKKNKKGKVIGIIGLFVDDMIVSCSSREEIEKLSEKLRSFYKLKEIEADSKGMQRFLGINMFVNRDSEDRTTEIKINQKEYILDMIDKYEIQQVSKIKTPLPPGYYYVPDKSKPFYSSENVLKLAKKSFKEKIGSLLYLSVMTRPDICYAVNYLAQFCEYPHPELFDMIERIMQYLYNTTDNSLIYRNYKIRNIICYTDSDYAQDPLTRRSMNGYIITVNGGIVYWKSKYTSLVCTSSAEAELQALFVSTNEMIWFRQLTIFLGMYKKSIIGKIKVDNMSIVLSLNNDSFSQQLKHYAVRLFAVKERINSPSEDDPYNEDNKRFEVEHISGELQLADILTKPISVKTIKSLIPFLFNQS